MEGCRESRGDVDLHLSYGTLLLDRRYMSYDSCVLGSTHLAGVTDTDGFRNSLHSGRSSYWLGYEGFCIARIGLGQGGCLLYQRPNTSPGTSQPTKHIHSPHTFHTINARTKKTLKLTMLFSSLTGYSLH